MSCLFILLEMIKIIVDHTSSHFADGNAPSFFTFISRGLTELFCQLLMLCDEGTNLLSLDKLLYIN